METTPRVKKLAGQITSPTSVILVLGVVLGALWLHPHIRVFPDVAINDNTSYLLSAIAQSLAAILALVFTISLIVAQLSSRYSHRTIVHFFDRWTIAFIILYITGIMLPIFLLFADSPHLGATKACVVVAAVCLCLLVPYFLRFRQRLDPDYAISEMSREAIEQLRNRIDTEPKPVATIDNFVMSAFSSHDYDTFGAGVDAIAKLAMYAYENGNDDVGKSILHRLRQIGSVTMDNPKAPIQVLTSLSDIGEIASRSLPKASQEIVHAIAFVSLRAIDKGFEDYVITSIDNLDKIARVNKETAQDNTLTVIIEQLGWYIAPRSAQKNLEPIVIKVANIIGNIGLMKGTSQQSHNITYRSAFMLGMVGNTAVENRLSDATKKSLWVLHTVFTNAVSQKLDDSADRAVDFMSRVSDRAIETGLEDISGEVIRIIKKLDEPTDKALELGMDRSVKRVIAFLGSVAHTAFESNSEEIWQVSVSTLADSTIKAQEKGFDNAGLLGVTWLATISSHAVLAYDTERILKTVGHLTDIRDRTGLDVTSVDYSQQEGLNEYYRSCWSMGNNLLDPSPELADAFVQLKAMLQ